MKDKVKITSKGNKYVSSTGKYSCQLSKNDRSSCAVYAVAMGFEIPYEEAFQVLVDKCQRKKNQGTNTYKMNQMLNSLELNGKSSVPVLDQKGHKSNLKFYKMRNGEELARALTVNRFLDQWPQKNETYIVSIRKHVFMIKDGMVYGNAADADRKGKRIHRIWKIINN